MLIVEFWSYSRQVVDLSIPGVEALGILNSNYN